MPRSQQIINGFIAGEVSPQVWGRTESQEYPYTCEALRNCYVSGRGGIFRRPGMHYVRPTKFPGKKVRLIPFVFSRTQSYVLEFGDGYVRFFRDSGYVENVNAVKAFIGDGSSTKYLYPHPEVAEADIKVIKNGTELTTPTDYTVAPANITTSQIIDYDTPASWDLNYNDPDDGAAPSPWVLDGGGTAVSPTDGEPILRQADINIARGSIVDVTFDVTAFSKVSDPFQYVLLADGSLGEDFSEVVFTTLTGRPTGWGHAIVDFSVSFQAANPNTSDVVTAELQYGNDTDGWTVVTSFAEVVDNTPSIFSRTDELITGPFKEGDQFRVVAKQANDLAADIQTIATSSIDVNAIVDYYAGLNTFVINAQDEESRVPTTLDGLTGTATFELLDSEVTNNYPLRWKHQTDPGVTVTLENLSVINKRDGWEITFVVPPSIADVVVILDGSSQAAQVGVQEIPQPDGDFVVRQNVVASGGPSTNAPDDNLPDIYEIESPFEEDELDDIYFAQANDQMFLCHVNHKPWRLTRYNAYDWRFEQPTFTGAPWEDGQYSPVNGYPQVVTFFQERLWFAATLEKPQTIWGSEAANFYTFTLPGDADPYDPDDAVEYTIAAYTHEQVEWVSSERVLVWGTSQTEHRLAPDQYIASDRLPKMSRMSAYGGAHIIPAYMGNMTVFVHTSRLQLRSYAQSTQSVVEQWESVELDWAASHLTADGIKQIAYALNPDSVLLMNTDEGDMLSMTYETSLGDAASPGWAKHETIGDIQSLTVIPQDTEDQGWVVVEREIVDVDDPQGDPIKYKYVEFLDTLTFTDSALTYPPFDYVDNPSLYPPLQNVGNLEHMEGQTLTVRANDATHPDVVVQNGEVTLNAEYQFIELGLKYTPYCKLKRHEGGNPSGTDQGQKGRWAEIWLRLVNSAFPKINGKRAAERHPSTPMNRAEPLVTGDVLVRNFGFDEEKQIEIEQDLPQPMYVTAVFGTYEVHAG